MTACNPPKLLEYNADTPTSLLEAAVIQWYWLESEHPQADQFNSLWEAVVARWTALKAAHVLGSGHALHGLFRAGSLAKTT